MIRLNNYSKIAFAFLLLFSVFISCNKSEQVAPVVIQKKQIATEVNGKIQISVDANFKTNWENQLEKQGLKVQLNDFELLHEGEFKDHMLFSATSKDETISTFFQVTKENGAYYINLTANTTCVGDPGCNGGCFKVKRTLPDGTVVWVCRARCYNGVDCVTSWVGGGLSGDEYGPH